MNTLPWASEIHLFLLFQQSRITLAIWLCAVEYAADCVRCVVYNLIFDLNISQSHKYLRNISRDADEKLQAIG
ncbi:hypothetical protein T12_9549 [Trichinella patagoniensis]|uniref:Uncharacterized protein n=1 Tax=Trichinella patagoniensis TaxID=990121 RepID=A0A0V0ZUS8_9BILA|nr:hypothetical protein T12_9549 [Trichinella patagoniensis]